MWCDVTWRDEVTWHDTWYDMTWYMTWHDVIWYDYTLLMMLVIGIVPIWGLGIIGGNPATFYRLMGTNVPMQSRKLSFSEVLQREQLKISIDSIQVLPETQAALRRIERMLFGCWFCKCLFFVYMRFVWRKWNLQIVHHISLNNILPIFPNVT